MNKDEKTAEHSEIISSEQNSQNDNNDDTAAKADNTSANTTADSSAESSTSKSESNTKNSTTASENADTNGLTLEQTVEILNNFYGTTYKVEAAEYENGCQSFNIIDKKGKAYATVKVDLSTGDATETIIQTNEVNDYNLLV